MRGALALRGALVCAALMLPALGAHAQSDGGGVDASFPLDAAVADAALTDAALTDAALPDAALPDATVPCGTVDALGLCQGTVRRACVQGSLVEEDCLAAYGTGFTCELEPGLGAAVCTAVPTDAGPPVDAGTEDAGPPRSNPLPSDDGAHCVKPAFGSPALLGVALWWVGPRRRRRTTPRT
jgi:hypothetical protein